MATITQPEAIDYLAEAHEIIIAAAAETIASANIPHLMQAAQAYALIDIAQSLRRIADALEADQQARTRLQARYDEVLSSTVEPKRNQ